ncbi:TPA: hypothetical protein ACKP22_003446 [Pseudomonas putida]
MNDFSRVVEGREWAGDLDPDRETGESQVLVCMGEREAGYLLPQVMVEPGYAHYGQAAGIRRWLAHRVEVR